MSMTETDKTHKFHDELSESFVLLLMSKDIYFRLKRPHEQK